MKSLEFCVLYNNTPYSSNNITAFICRPLCSVHFDLRCNAVYLCMCLLNFGRAY
jgi:hypothetical protein